MAEIIYLGGNYMLENWIKPQIPEEEELDERLHAARSKLSVLQMQIKEHILIPHFHPTILRKTKLYS